MRIGKRPQAVQAHGEQAFKDVAFLSMLRRTPMLVHEPEDFFETGDQPFFLGRSRSGLDRGQILPQFGQQGLVLVPISHDRYLGPRPPCVAGRAWPRPPRLRPFFAPTGLAS
ncbi:hypothetical protein G6F40_017641 [Rhizopus arrhizus]|nr:hypothetical protein G6F40_017641 [Rhizopus arrhizus]KAG1242905.1 hypothetical protein G6F65_022754 [Rhizopus arrhizus]